MRPDKKTISLLKNNLVEVVKKVNHYHNEIWFRIFPPEGLNKDYFKKTKPAFIKEIGQSPEFALYIHIPFCKNRCDYCSLRGGCDIKKVGTFNYVNCLKLELGQMFEKRKDRKILSILIGGGTPSLLEAEDINCLIKYLRKNFTIGPKAQICMEAAPSDISRKMGLAEFVSEFRVLTKKN